jgi:hypothetical protein
MVQTVVTPEKANLDITVQLPESYIGRQVHILFYTDDEIKTTNASVLPKKKPSDFFGMLGLEEGEKMQKYITKSRKEWERDV